MITLFLILCY
ncbi:IMV membrane protein A21, partial [Monkeypox virus]